MEIETRTMEYGCDKKMGAIGGEEWREKPSEKAGTHERKGEKNLQETNEKSIQRDMLRQTAAERRGQGRTAQKEKYENATVHGLSSRGRESFGEAKRARILSGARDSGES
jgi:hypothetical protein